MPFFNTSRSYSKNDYNTKSIAKKTTKQKKKINKENNKKKVKSLNKL